MTDHDIPLRKIDHVRFFVGNARQSAYFYRNAFGFDVVAYAGLETKVRHEAGYVLRQGEITFVLVSPLSEQHPDSRRLITHGDGVMDIAMDVPDVRGSFYRSDHFPLARVGVPALSIQRGEDYVGRTREWAAEQESLWNTRRYHQPSDQYSPAFDYRGMVQQVRVAVRIARAVADAAALPQWNAASEFQRGRSGR